MYIRVLNQLLLYLDSAVNTAVRLAKGQSVILAWFGCERPPPGHPLSEDGNVFLSYDQEQMTQCATESLDFVWLKHIIMKCGRGKEILELFSQCGMSCMKYVMFACPSVL